VDSIVWSSGTGQLPLSGAVPQTGTTPIPPGRFAVRLRLHHLTPLISFTG